MDTPLKTQESGKTQDLVEGTDFYREGQCMVFTAHFLLKRGNCCGSGCRHCPYRKKGKQGDSR